MLSPISKALIVKMMIGLSHSAVPLDPSQVLEFSISKNGMTRITIENDGIEDIYAYPNDYSENIQKHGSGHVFIVGDGIDEPVYLTVITKRGIAQDMRLVARGKKASPIILKFEDPEAERKRDETKVSEILKGFLSGGSYPGFMKTEPKEGSRSRGDMEAIAVSSYRGEAYLVTEFTIKNQGRGSVLLDPSVLWNETDLAVVFNAESLDSFGEAKMYVIQKS